MSDTPAPQPPSDVELMVQAGLGHLPVPTEKDWPKLDPMVRFQIEKAAPAFAERLGASPTQLPAGTRYRMETGQLGPEDAEPLAAAGYVATSAALRQKAMADAIEADLSAYEAQAAARRAQWSPEHQEQLRQQSMITAQSQSRAQSIAQGRF